ncbi:MAG: signal peptidase I [Clostridia bacterium]|nr:signal peptidase I [Clostridia bacterium]
MSEIEKKPAEETAAENVEAAEAAPETGKKKEKKSVGKEILDWVVTIVVAVLIALVIRTFIFEPVRVDGHSMDYTLADGEIMFVSKFNYTTLPLVEKPIFGNPERFDIVICHYPGRGATNFVKRVVGLPGDTVQIMGGYLFVNGEMYEEEYIVNRPNYITPPIKVPEGCYYVLGDNRSNSNDSHIIGPIKREMIVGKVLQVMFPFSNWRAINR